MEWFDRTFTIPHSIKMVTGSHYYLWRDDIKKGHIFLTNIKGVGSNLINPSPYKHGAIYFGRGLKQALTNAINDPAKYNYSERKRLEKFLQDNAINDHICYVIEAVGKGVVATNLVEFLTTKDEVKILEPKFTDSEGMSKAADMALKDLGLPYDFGFHPKDDSKYCFEVVADAYEKTNLNLKLKKIVYKLFGKTLYSPFLAETFLDKVNFSILIDSKDY